MRSRRKLADSKDYFDLTLVTPSGTREEFNVRHMRAPGAEGYFGVLADHLPFITTIKTGEIDVDTKDGKKFWATSGGFVEVLGSRVIILAETAELAEQIDLQRAEASRERATKRLRENPEGLDVLRCQLALTRAINRLRVASYID